MDSGHTWSYKEDFAKQAKDIEAFRERVKELEQMVIFLRSRHEQVSAMKLPDVEILKEFRRRFNGSCLYEMDSNVVLQHIGIDTIKRYLKECFGLATRKAR